MPQVVQLSEFREWRGTPLLMLVDMHHGLTERDTQLSDLGPMLRNCREALAYARLRAFPIAFFRRVEGPKYVGGAVRIPTWLPGFEPGRTDMVFDRKRPSCYASSEFGDVASHTGGNCVIVGLFGETSCLSTAVDAFHRDHPFTFLADASASRGSNGLICKATHDMLTYVVSHYARVLRTQHWIRLTSQRAEAVGS